ncbi:MAG: hypothetical protein KGJ84_03895 [Elusimicrobia bacterium]|nr:hypothetical protein [Elusimicrobiota bacterium]
MRTIPRSPLRGAAARGAVFLSLALLALPVHAAPKTWTGTAGDNLWNTAGNWNPASVPTNTDAVTIGAAASVNASGTAINFSSLTIGSPLGAAVGLTLATTITSGGSVLVYKNSGLTLATNSLVTLGGDLTLVSGSSLTHTSNGTTQSYAVNLSVSGLFDLQAGATVTLSGAGYAGGAIKTAGSGPGAGGGASVNNAGGGGGGHGGAGSAGTSGTAGTANDSSTNPVNIGSGGGGGRAGGGGGVGGSGGGLATISAQSMNLLGRIVADGSDGVSGAGSGGAGAGGGVNLTAAVVLGAGGISARGGAGGSTLGGGGGGGLISINATQSGSVCGISFDVSGGTGTSTSGTGGVVSTTATLASPTSFTGASPTTGTIRWDWSRNGAITYQVFSSTGGNGQSPVLSQLTSTYASADLLPNTTYAFKVRTIACSQTVESAVYSLATLPNAPAAASPAFVAVGSSLLRAQWTALPASPQTQTSEGYLLQMSTDSAFNGTLVSSTVYSSFQSTLSATGLFPNTTYYARVASLNWAGALSSFTTLGSTSTLSSPVAQPQIFATFGTSMTVNWTPAPSAPPDASSKTAEGYRVELSTTSNFTGVIFSSSTPAVTLATLTVSGLSSETQYYARVGAANWNGSYDYATASFAVTKDTTPPSAVTNLAAAVGADAQTVGLTWTAPGNNGAVGCVTGGRYRIDYASYTAYSFSNTKYQVDISSSFCPGDAQSRSLTGLLPNTTYFVRVYALDQDLNAGPLSNGATQSTLASPVSTLSTTFLQVNPSSVTAAWAALPVSPPDASSKTAEGYRVEASSTNFSTLLGGIVYSSATSQVLASTLSVSGLSSGVTYYFRVAALNWGSAPNYTVLGSTLTATTVGAAPTGVNVFAVYGASITLNWTAVNSDGGYLAQASTAANYSGTLYSSSTTNGLSTALTPQGLNTNTTYYLRVGALWGTTTSYAAVLSTSSLAAPVSNTSFNRVYFTSAAVSWTGLPLSPPDASSKTSEGYAVDASTAPDFTGTVFSSATRNAALTTLVVPGLSVNTTYYFRTGSLNWNGTTNYAMVGATSTLASFPAAGVPLFTGVFLSSLTAQWTAGTPANPAGTSYQLDASSTNFAAGTAVVSSTTLNLFGTPGGLLANTTYAFRVSALNNNSVPSRTVLASTSTLAPPVTFAAQPQFGVFETSAAVAWIALPVSPQEQSSLGYLLEASSTNFSALLPGGVVLSSQTIAVAASTLTVTGLDRNTTYYFRVGSLNWNSARNYAVTAPTSTLTSPLSALQSYQVFETSITLNWAALPSTPQSATAQGYRIDASTTNFGALSPGGAVFSSATTDVTLATLTVSGLTADATYYLRAGALDWNSVANYAGAGSTSTLSPPPGSPALTSLYTTSATVSWTPTTCQGYRLEASVSPTFSPLFFSSTTSAGVGSLTLSGLAADTTYYYRVGSLNWNSARNDTGLNPLSTLAVPPVGPFYPANNIYFTSATVQWTAVTAQGYLVDASTAADFSGTVLSSATGNGASTILVDTGLDSGTTYYVRVGALNWNSTPNYAVLAATATRLSPKTWTGATNSLWNTGTNWNPNGVPGKNDAVTIGIAASVNATGTAISFSSLTIGSPAGAPVGLTLSTAVANGGSVIIYTNSGLTLAQTATVSLNGDLTMVSGSSLSHTANGTVQSYEAALAVSGLFDLQAGASVTLSGLGYAGGAAQTAGSGPGAGGGASVNSAGGGGGGHGGAGSSGTSGAGGAANDSATNPANLGSSGGGGRSGGGGLPGGSGGGLTVISAQSMNVYGVIAADGADGGSGAGSGGGGSGGGVGLTVAVFAGTGTVTARGGAGGGTLGGGGGGGIVSIDVTQSGTACGLTFAVTGGTGTSASGTNGVVSTTATLVAPGSFMGLYPTTGTIHWNWSLTNGAANYQIFSSTGGGGISPLLSSLTTSYTTTGLLANTTADFFVRASACGQNSDSAVYSLATTPVAPSALSPAFVQADTGQLQARWTKLAASPQEQTSEGYRLEVSTDSNFNGTLFSSATYSSAQSTLTASGLAPNTTYYARVAALNWAAAASSYTILGATSTLASMPSRLASDYFAVYNDSTALQWAALPAGGAEGYILEASTTNFSALSPGGTILSSATTDIAVSTLVIQGITLPTTYYFRLGSINHGSLVNYENLQRLNLELSQSVLVLHLGSMDPSVSMSTVSVSSFVITNLGNLPVTYSLSAQIATPGSPWSFGSAPGNETAELQGLWNSAQPVPGAFSTPILLSTRPSGGPGGAYAGDQTAVQVMPGESRTLWFRFSLPTATTADPSQTMTLTLDALYP